MGKWYLHPDGNEWDEWVARRISQATAPTTVQRVEPEAAVSLPGGKVLAPLTDAGASPPAGKVVDERTVTFDSEAGTATVGYTYRDATAGEVAQALAARKARMVAAVKAKATDLVTAGFTYAIPGESPADPHVYSITDSDQNNMLSVQVRFSKGGSNCHNGYWRCTSNHNVEMDDTEVQAFFDAAYEYKLGILRNSATLADAIRVAANGAALNLIDIDAGTIDGAGGWPANSS